MKNILILLFSLTVLASCFSTVEPENPNENVDIESHLENKMPENEQNKDEEISEDNIEKNSVTKENKDPLEDLPIAENNENEVIDKDETSEEENVEVASNNENTIMEDVISDEMEFEISAPSDPEESFSCDDEFEELMGKYWKSYSDCTFKKPKINTCEVLEWEKSAVNVIVIFDDSGSMGKEIWNETMLDIAKEKLTEYIEDIAGAENTNIWFILYWHKWDWTQSWKQNSCEWVEVIQSLSWNASEKIISTISSLEPNWWTPIASSLSEAKNMIKNKAWENDKNVVLLISDWIETCWWKPLVEARMLWLMKNTYVDVIWFNVWWDDELELSKIAKMWKWSYFNVKNRADFETVFNQTKTFFSAMNCSTSRASLEITYAAKAIDTYYSCVADVYEEATMVVTNSTWETCKKLADEKMNKRIEYYKEEFKPILDAWEDILDWFEKHMEKVIEKFDK